MTQPNKYLKGVYKPKDKPGFKAKAYRLGKSIYIGSFPTEKEAHEAYLQFVKNIPPATPGPSALNARKKIHYDNLRTAWYGL